MESLAVSTSLPGELKITSANVWTQLVPRTGANANGLSCKFVRFSAPTAASPNGSVNANSALIVSYTDAQGNPKQPTTNAGAWELPKTATGLNYEMTADATCVWVLVLSANDAVEYAIGS